VDILVLTKDSGAKNRVREAIELNKETAYRLYRVGVTAIVYDLKEFERAKKRKSPLVIEVLKEGMPLLRKEVS